MSTKRKLSVIDILCLVSYLSCVIAAAVRIYYVYKFLYVDNRTREESFGPVIANLTIWSTIEPACSVIAACLPTLGPLGQKGRNPESLVASVRSVLSLRSYNTSIRTEKHGNGSLDNSKCSRSLEGDEEARGGWAKNSGTGSTTVESGMNIRSAPKSVEIVMEKGFSSE